MNNVLTGEFGNDLLYGLLIPGIILFLILSEFASFVAGSHKGIKHLVTIAALGVIIQSGWYAMIAGVSSIYIPLVLVYFILVFFKRKLITRKQEGAGAGIGGKLWKFSGADGHMKNAIDSVQPGRSKQEKDTATAEILSIGSRFDSTKNKPDQGVFVQSNTDQTLKLLVEEAKDVLLGFRKKDREDILKTVLTKRGKKNVTDDEFLTLLFPLAGM